MNSKWYWTDEIIQEFVEFVRADGCTVVGVRKSLSGQCTFSMTLPVNSVVTPDDLMDRFIRHKNSQTSIPASV